MNTEQIDEEITVRLSPEAAKALFVMQRLFDTSSRNDIVSSAIVITHVNVVSMFGFLSGMPARVFMRFIAIVATLVGMGLLIGWLTDDNTDAATIALAMIGGMIGLAVGYVLRRTRGEWIIKSG